MLISASSLLSVEWGARGNRRRHKAVARVCAVALRSSPAESSKANINRSQSTSGKTTQDGCRPTPVQLRACHPICSDLDTSLIRYSPVPKCAKLHDFLACKTFGPFRLSRIGSLSRSCPVACAKEWCVLICSSVVRDVSPVHISPGKSFSEASAACVDWHRGCAMPFSSPRLVLPKEKQQHQQKGDRRSVRCATYPSQMLLVLSSFDACSTGRLCKKEIRL